MKTTIEWASHTLNYFSWACTKVSPGCKNCYAKALAERYGKDFNAPPQWRGANAMKELRALPAGAIVFVNSMSDTYHESVPAQWVHSIHNAALLRPDVVFLLLTKRPERALGLSPYLAYPPNLWVGTSVESEDYLWRLDYLLKIPAAGHFVSAEPLLGRLPALSHYLKPLTSLPGPVQRQALKWVIVGGESGTGRRPFYSAWAAEIQVMCAMNNVPFMYKQGSAFKSGQDRFLNGRTWDETPFAPYTPADPINIIASAPVFQKELF
jgi:protein gp37